MTQLASRLRRHANILTVMPSGLLILAFVYGFILWSFTLSLTNSTIVPNYKFIGFDQYVLLWQNARWQTSVANLAIYSSVFVLASLAIGMLQAILIDQNIRGENAIRTIYLYPMAISFIVTGTAWKWMLNPGLGLEKMVRGWGFESFTFDWIVDPDKAIYTLSFAAIWQASGFAMAIFLAALRGVDNEVVRAARMEGASTFQVYRIVILPLLRPAVFTASIVLVSLALRTFDLMIAMTGGGPGFSSDLPTNFFYQFAFARSRLGFAAAGGVMIFVAVLLVMGPFILSELKNERKNER